MSGGINPRFGRDPGPRPPFGPVGNPLMTQGQAYIPHHGLPIPGVFGGAVPPYAFGASPAGFASMPYVYPGVAPVQPSHMAAFGQQTGMFAGPINVPGVPPQPNGTGVTGWNPRMPQPMPQVDPSMPAAHMTNSTGGTGCEPGYNYFFPAEHTKIHVFTTSTPPWQLPPGALISFKACHVPCNATLADLLKGFGCTNPSPKKNRCFEIVQGGNGRWYKGLCFSGDDRDAMKKTIKSLGWDETRTGRHGGKPVVCVWMTKD